MLRRFSGLFLIVVVFFLSGMSVARSQILVESVAAIVGNEVIYLSDIENMVLDLRSSGNRTPVDELRCSVLRELLISKLFLDQARIDSIIVTDDMVENELNARINDAIRRSGSEEALETYFRKSMIEIRRDIRKALVDQEIVSQVQGSIAENIKITPNELRKYYSSIPKDSLPVIPARVQISIIQLDPPDNDENKAEARQRLLDIRGRILAGQSFSSLAIMYSEDPGTAPRGGELGYMLRGELEKPYADEAFSLTKNTVSRIIETRFGFHIIQVIDRNGDLLNTRHILIRPKVKPEQTARAMNMLDSLANKIRKDSLKFEDAAIRYSSHKDSRINGGKLVSTNPSRRDNWFTLEELNPQMYVQVRDLKVGEISTPFRTTDENNNEVFRIVRLDNEIPAHRANLKDDYQQLGDAALMKKRTRTYENWIKKKIEVTYIKVSDEFESCDFLKEGWLK
ncbi:MAG TPA: peptidylprolyl isomerase [Bacteroidales bacterium]|nr:peptidylprolyl isomerase [Bacteroidales bacterium]